MGKLIAIEPSRARSRQYQLDLCYFNWCLLNYKEYLAHQLIISMLGASSTASSETEVTFFEAQIVTKETLDLAHKLVMMSILQNITKSAIMLLCADSSNGTLAE